jgi:hypothetical protein
MCVNLISGHTYFEHSVNGWCRRVRSIWGARDWAVLHQKTSTDRHRPSGQQEGCSGELSWCGAGGIPVGARGPDQSSAGIGEKSWAIGWWANTAWVQFEQ